MIRKEIVTPTKNNGKIIKLENKYSPKYTCITFKHSIVNYIMILNQE